MRWLLFLGVTAFLSAVSSGQDEAPDGLPREASRRPISDFFENLRGEFLPGREQSSGAGADSHKLVLQLSEELFTSLINRDINRDTAVQDVILGTPVFGSAHTVGSPHIDLVPNPTQAAFAVVMDGTTVSRTTGRNGPAVIQNRSTTSFRASKQVLFSPREGFYAQPAAVASNTTLVTENIASTRGGLIGRIVRRRAGQEVQAKHWQAQAIADARARRRVAAVLDEQVNAGLAKLNRRKDVRGLLTTFISGTNEPLYACCTTEHFVQIAAALSPATQRPIVLPPAEYLTSPVQLWVHRSLLRPPLPAILSRLGSDRRELSELLIISRIAPATAIGAEVLKTAMTEAEKSSAFDFQTVEDWTVVEFGKEPRQSSRVVRR